jgi:hypothetical protein
MVAVYAMTGDMHAPSFLFTAPRGAVMLFSSPCVIAFSPVSWARALLHSPRPSVCAVSCCGCLVCCPPALLCWRGRAGAVVRHVLRVYSCKGEEKC